MTPADLRRLRLALWVLAATACAGTLAELVLLGHWGSPVQALPLALTGMGVVASGIGTRPGRTAARVAFGAGVLLAAGGLFGVWEHFEHNHVFAAEIRPTASAGDLLVAAIGGASPLLAPGALGLAGALLALSAWVSSTGLSETREV